LYTISVLHDGWRGDDLFVKYEVDHTWAGVAWPEADDDEEPTPARIARTIEAVYEDTALRGGRIIASHTLIIEGREHLFFVSEFPDDEPAGSAKS
jgi:hypothetical protein